MRYIKTNNNYYFINYFLLDTVRGTVVSSSYYSENGSEPVGEVTVTQYSSDPNELGIDTSRNKQRLHGLAAITTTQKFGRNSPAAVSNTRTTPLKAITTGNKVIF